MDIYDLLDADREKFLEINQCNVDTGYLEELPSGTMRVVRGVNKYTFYHSENFNEIKFEISDDDPCLKGWSKYRRYSNRIELDD